MASNYPNMSYCMFENTKLSLNQVLEEMIEAREENRAAKFLNGLNREERRAFSDMYEMCQQYANLAEMIEQETAAEAFEDADIDETDDSAEWNASNGQGD